MNTIISIWPFGISEVAAPVVIPTLASLLVFVLGWVVKFIYDKVIERKRITTYRKVVFEWSSLVCEAARKQKNSLMELSEKLAVTDSLYPEKYTFSRSMSDKLKDLTAEQAISVFVNNCRVCVNEDKRAKYAFNLVSQYDFLASIESTVFKQYDAYNSYANELREEWNTLIIALFHEIDAVRFESTMDEQVHCQLKEIINIFLKKKIRIDLLEETYLHLIRPLNERIHRFKVECPEVRSFFAAYECAQKMELLYRNWKASNNGYSIVFKNLASAIDVSISSLYEAIEYFKQSTRVPLGVN